MNLSKLQDLISNYHNYIDSKNNFEHLHLYEIQKNYKEHWGLMKEPLHEMIDQSIESQITRRLWTASNYEPKEMLLAFAKLNPDYIKQMFRDLYNEDKSIDGRMDRFIFYCDEMLKEYKRAFKNKVTNNHHHDHKIISLYLSLEYPDQYSLYNHNLFTAMLKYLSAKNISTAPDPARYFKIVKLILNFLDKKEGLFDSHQARLNPEIHFSQRSGMMVYELMMVNNM